MHICRAEELRGLSVEQLEQVYQAAVRWQKVVELTKIEIKSMNQRQRKAWDRLKRGGWFTGDLEALIDELDDAA